MNYGSKKETSGNVCISAGCGGCSMVAGACGGADCGVGCIVSCSMLCAQYCAMGGPGLQAVDNSEKKKLIDNAMVIVEKKRSNL